MNSFESTDTDPSYHQHLTEALNEWRSKIGPQHCLTDAEILNQYSKTTFKSTQKIPAILKPGNLQEVQECVRIANSYRIKIHAISSGKNHGYGSAVPPQNCVLIHLSRMNQIIDFNAKTATVTVEPGVTQRQLYEFLQSQKTNLIMDATGASEYCSVLGNTTERGFGHTPYGNHFEQVIDIQVVLPNGDMINTGFGAFQNALSKGAYRYAPGPVIDGLFFQANFGIVTRMTIALMPKPQHFESFYFSLQKQHSLAELIDALQPLRLDGTLHSAIHIGNDFKSLNTFSIYPWDTLRGEKVIPPDILRQLCDQFRFGIWNGSGAFYGSWQHVHEAKSKLKKALKNKVHTLFFMNDFTLHLAKIFPWLPTLVSGKDISPIFDKIEAIYNLEKGIPTDVTMKSVYWRKAEVPESNFDPDRDGCGLIWFSPLAPTEGKHAVRLKEICDTIMTNHGFEPMISITLLTERAMIGVMSICYDRLKPGEDEKAMACHDALMTTCAKEGYYAYRYGVQATGRYPDYDPNYRQFLTQLKSAIDPNNILSPGKYGL